MEPTLQAVIEVIRGFIGRHMGQAAADSITADMKLLRSGLVDSFHLVELSEEVMRAFDLDPNEDFLVPDDFVSPRRLWERLRAERDGAAEGDEPDADLPPLRRGPDDAPRQLSYWQQVVLGWELKRPPSSTWVRDLRLRLRGRLDRAKLEAAFRALLERQEGLRQRFGQSVDEPPSLWDVGDMPWTVVEMRDPAPGAADAFCEAHANAPVVVAGGPPLLRAFLLAHADDDHTLLILYHQLLNDATARHLIMRELVELYAALVEGRAPHLAALPVRYVDYAAWERATFEGPAAARVEASRRAVEGVPPLALPTDFPRPPGPLSGGLVMAQFSLDAGESARFADVCKDYGTLFGGFSVVLAAVLHRWCRQDDVVFTAPTNTRWSRETQPLIGRFGNWVPLRFSFADDPTLGEAFARASDARKVAHGYATAPAPLVYGTDDVFGHPFTRVILNTPEIDVGSNDVAMSVAGVAVEVEPVRKPVGGRTELATMMLPNRQAIAGHIVGASDLFTPETVRKFAGWLRTAFVNLRPDQRASEVRVD